MHFDVPIGRVRLLGIVALAVLVALGAAAYAAFTTSTATPTHATGTADMQLTLGATGTVTNRFDIPATAMAAGDTAERTLDLIVGGTAGGAPKRIDVLVAAGAGTLRNPAGLRVIIEQCSVSWTEHVPYPPHTATCGGTTTTPRADISLDALTWLFTQTLITGSPTVAGTQHLKVTFTLPSGLDYATYGNVSLAWGPTFTFTGVQQDGTNK